MKNKIIVTDHAEDRIRKRWGVPRRAVQAIAEKAYSDGVSYKKSRGAGRKYLNSVRLKSSNNESRVYRIYNYHLFIFSSDYVLITVYAIHNKLKQKRRKSKDSLI